MEAGKLARSDRPARRRRPIIEAARPPAVPRGTRQPGQERRSTVSTLTARKTGRLRMRSATERPRGRLPCAGAEPRGGAEVARAACDANLAAASKSGGVRPTMVRCGLQRRRFGAQALQLNRRRTSTRVASAEALDGSARTLPAGVYDFQGCPLVPIHVFVQSVRREKRAPPIAPEACRIIPTRWCRAASR
jgi:hypothetical protein